MPLLCQSARGRAAGASQDAQAENFLGGCRPQVPFFSGAGGGAGPGLLSGCCGGLLLGQRRVAEPAHALASLALKPCAHGLIRLEQAFTPTVPCKVPQASMGQSMLAIRALPRHTLLHLLAKSVFASRSPGRSAG